MKPAPFTYLRPTGLAEVLGLLAAHGDEAKPIAGGQSLMPMLNLRLARAEYLVDLARIPNLGGIDPDASGPDHAGTGLRLGAMVRHRDLVWSPAVRARAPLLALCAPLIGHPAIRNRGTVGGSVVHADPAAELPAALLALDAEVRLASTAGERTVAAEGFFEGVFTTATRPDELVTEVRVPGTAARPRTGWGFEEFARRHGDFALVAVAAGIEIDEMGRGVAARLVFAGLAGAPRRAREAEAVLRGQTVSDQVITEAARIGAAPLELPADAHASMAYRREVARVCAERALRQAWWQARPEGTDG